MSNNKQRHLEVYEFIKNFISKNGFPPTVREICSSLGFSSTSTAQYYLKKLESMNLISFGSFKNRAICLKTQAVETKTVPIVGTVAAGSPILAVENIEEYCALPNMFNQTDETFILKIKGDSMIEAGIYDGDNIVVKKCSSCDNGAIIVALVDDSATCKRFFKRDGKIILHPENSSMEDMIFDDVLILGVVEGLIRKF